MLMLADRDALCGIRVPYNANAAVEYAAEELRRYLRLLTGQPLVDRAVATSGMVFLNDWSSAAEAGIKPEALGLTGDAFHLQNVGNDLYLLAANDRGVVYGVNEVLRKLGVRWYTPEIMRIPRLRMAALPQICQTVRPAFEYRDMIALDCADPQFLTRLRVNGHFSRIPSYMGGHEAYGLHVHTYYTLVPPQKYFAAHPEYFSLVDGKRRDSGAQLCLTNPEVCRIAATHILKMASANPQARIFSVSQNDWHGACECATCRQVVKEEGAQSGPVLRFANAVADAVAKVRPDLLISTLAYTYTLDAPRKVVPRPNVRVRLCPIRCCSGHPFGTCDHQETQRFMTAIEKWSALTPQMYIWHYSINFSHSQLPYPNFDELAGNIQFYQDRRVHGLFVQDMGTDGFGAESADLRGFLQAELMWNPQVDIWSLVNEWVGAVHDKAAPAVMRYYSLLHNFVREHRDIHPVCYAPPDHPLYNQKLMAEADTALADGEKLASGFSKKRIQKLRCGLKLPHLYTCGGLYEIQGSKFVGKSNIHDVKAIDTIAKQWRSYGITHPGEGESRDAVINSWRARIEPHVITRLTSGGHTLGLVPTLGGRILTWEAHGRQWLSLPDPDNPHQAYPFSGGYAEMAICGVYSFQGWRNSYTLRRAGCKAATVAAIAKHWSCGVLELRRKYELRNGELVIESSVSNRDSTAQSFRWDGCFQWQIAEWTKVEIIAGDVTESVVATSLEDTFAKARIVATPHGGRTYRVNMPEFTITNCFGAEVNEIVVGVNRQKGVLQLMCAVLK